MLIRQPKLSSLAHIRISLQTNIAPSADPYRVALSKSKDAGQHTVDLILSSMVRVLNPSKTLMLDGPRRFVSNARIELDQKFNKIIGK